MLGVRKTLQKVFLRRDPNEPQPKEIDLGQSGGFHYDTVKGRWVIDGEKDTDEEDSRPPPIISTPAAPATRTRSRYVDPLASSEPSAAPFRPVGRSLEGESEANPIPASATLTTPKEERKSEKEDRKSEEVIRSYESQVVQEELLRKVEALQSVIAGMRADYSEKMEHLQVEKEELEARVDLLTTDKAKAYMTVRELEFELKSEKEEKSSLETEISSLKSVILDRERDVLALRLSVRNTENDPIPSGDTVEELQIKLAQSETEKLNFQRILAEKDQKNSELREQLEILTEKSLSLTREIERMKYDFQLTLNFKEEESGRQAEHLARSRSELSRVKELHKQASEQLDRHVSQKEEFELRVGILSQAKSRADVELKKAIFERIQAETDSEHFLRQVKELQSQVRSLEEQHDRGRLQEYQSDGDIEAIIEARMEMQRLEGEKLALREEMMAMRRKNEEIEEKLAGAVYTSHQLAEEGKSIKIRAEQHAKHVEESKIVLSSELETVRGKLTQTLKLLEKTQSEKNELESRTAIFNAEEREKFIGKIEALEGEIRKVRDDSEAERKEWRDLEADLRAKVSDLEQKQGTPTEDFNLLQSELSTLTEKLSDMEDALRQQSDTVHTLEIEKKCDLLAIAEQQAKNSILERTNQSLSERIDEAENGWKMSAEDLRSTQGKLADVRQGSMATIERLSASESAYISLIASSSQISEANNRAQLSLSAANSEILSLQSQLEDCLTRESLLTAQISDLDHEIEESEVRKQELAEEVLNLQETIAQQEESIYEMRTMEIQRSTNDGNVTSESLDSAMHEIERLKSEIEEARVTMQNQSKKVIDCANAEKTTLKEALANSKQSEDALISQLEKTRTEVRIIAKRLEDAGSKEAKLRSESDDLRRELHTLRSTVLENDDCISGLRFQMHQLDAELTQSKERTNILTGEVAELKHAMKEQRTSFEHRVKDAEAETAKITQAAKDDCAKYLSEIEDMRTALQVSTHSREEDEEQYQLDLQRLQQISESDKDTISSLNASLARSEKMREEMEGKVRESREKWESEKSRNEELRRNTKESEGKVNRLTEETEALKVELASLQAEIKGLRGSLANSESENEGLRTDLANSVAEIESLRVNLVTFEAKIGGLIDNLTGLERENQSLKSDMSSERSKLSSENEALQIQLRSLHSENSALQIETVSLTTQKSALESDLKLLRESYEKLKIELNSTAETAKNSESISKDTKSRLESLQSEVNSRQTVIAALQIAKDDLETRLNHAATEGISLKSVISTLESDKSRLEKAVSGHKVNLEHLKKHYEELIIKDRQTATAAFEAQSSELSAKESLLKSLQGQLDAMHRSTPSASNDLKGRKLEEEISDLQRKLSESNENLEELYEKNFTLQQEAAVSSRLASEKQQLLEELKSLRESDGTKLKDSLRRREEEISVLRQELLAVMERISQPELEQRLTVDEDLTAAEIVLPPAAPAEAMTANEPVEEAQANLVPQGWVSGFLSAMFLTEREQTH